MTLLKIYQNIVTYAHIQITIWIFIEMHGAFT